MRGQIIAGLLADSDGLVRLLAVVGGAVLGAIIIGFLANLLARLATTRKLPRWAANVVRLLGAVAAGWLVALWVFGGGGAGIGGSGGWGFGSGTGRGESTAKVPSTGQTVSPSTAAKAPNELPDSDSNTLRVEVLGAAALKRLGKAELERCYRVDADGGPRLLTLKEVKDLIAERLKKEPPLRHVALVLYKDSPAPGVSFVEDLRAWAVDRKMKVDVVAPDADAPTL
jgi:hypothetical protein